MKSSSFLRAAYALWEGAWESWKEFIDVIRQRLKKIELIVIWFVDSFLCSARLVPSRLYSRVRPHAYAFIRYAHTHAHTCNILSIWTAVGIRCSKWSNSFDDYNVSLVLELKLCSMVCFFWCYGIISMYFDKSLTVMCTSAMHTNNACNIVLCCG